MGLSSLAKVEALSTKCSLVDLTILCSTEWHSIVLQLESVNWIKLKERGREGEERGGGGRGEGEERERERG